MRVLVAPDKFAGTLTAVAAAEAVARGWSSAAPDDVLDLAPMADGGPGFLACLAARLPGDLLRVETCGPLGQQVSAEVLVVETPAGRRGYVEAAQVVGLAVSDQRDPWRASTAGLAPVLAAATAAGAAEVVVGVGGTASTDGGRGLVEAIGRWPQAVGLVAAVDVDAPLLGPTGAAQGFGPQKGATPDQVEQLEARLASWAADRDGDPAQPGAGAGGGLGFGLQTLGARTVRGADVVAEAVDLRARIRVADVVVTGEGRLDWSSLHGKVVGTVARLCREADRSCLALVGQVRLGERELRGAGLVEAASLVDLLGSTDAAMADAPQGLSALAAEVAARWPRA